MFSFVSPRIESVHGTADVDSVAWSLPKKIPHITRNQQIATENNEIPGSQRIPVAHSEHWYQFGSSRTQHWNVYRKWNDCLYEEMLTAHHNGRAS